jgi:hypothetical protein
LVIVSLIALYGGLNWLINSDTPENRSNWIITLGALSIAAAIRLQPGACLALGIALLLTGALFFNFNIRRLRLTPLLLVGGLSLSALPWTPGWPVVQLYSAPFLPVLLLLLISQSLLLAGYIRNLFETSPKSLGFERWVWALYIWGLALFILANWIISWWQLPGSQNPLRLHPGLLESWPGIAITLLVGLYFLSRRRKNVLPARITHYLHNRLDLDWLYRFIWRNLRTGRHLIHWSNTLLEGQAGILWAFLLLVLLLTLFTQSNPGG